MWVALVHGGPRRFSAMVALRTHNKRIAAARTDVGIGIGTQKQRSSTVGRRYSDGGVKLHSAPAGGTRRRFWASES